jgi:lipoyl(octanoyl) transferase
MSEIKTKNVQVFVKDLDLVNYEDALQIQEQYFNEGTAIKLEQKNIFSAAQPLNYLFLCEHPHVYTLGKSGSEAHLLLTSNELAEKSIAFFHNNRGGDITYHGPGQIVGYPILDLEQFEPDIKRYMFLLEEVIIKTIAEYGIMGDRIEGSTGVWLDVETRYERKICAFGVKTSRWITMHGWGLNVNTDLSYFNHIVPCGIANKGVTSLENELGRKINLEEVKEKLIRNFGLVFNAQMILY